MNLSYEVVGDDSLPPLLLLHGFLSSNLQWEPNEKALAKHFRLFKVELWGHGNSPVPTDSNAYSVEEYLGQIEIIRKQFSIDKWTLVGQSFGAGIVVNYAVKYPHRCYAVVVTNSMSAFSHNFVGTHPHRNEKVEKTKQLLTEKGVRGLPMHPIHSTRIETILKGKMVKVADAVPLSAVLGHFSLLKNLSTDTRLNKVFCPVLLTNGIFEKEFQTVVEFLKLDWPELEIKNLTAGHSVNLDSPQEFNSEVLNWLRSQTG